jgi:hypothetical protein
VKRKRARRAEQMWTLEEAMNMRLEQQPEGQPGKAVEFEAHESGLPPVLIVLP